MNIIKWICFIIVCSDTLSYILMQADKELDVGGAIGTLFGIVARVYVLYNTVTYWLLV